MIAPPPGVEPQGTGGALGEDNGTHAPQLFSLAPQSTKSSPGISFTDFSYLSKARQVKKDSSEAVPNRKGRGTPLESYMNPEPK